MDCKPDGTVASRLADEQSFSWLSDAAVYIKISHFNQKTIDLYQ